MRSFKDKDYVEITDPLHAMIGCRGSVVRLRMGDNGAWVNMSNEPPEAWQSFPKGDERHHHILLYPDQCKKIGPKS